MIPFCTPFVGTSRFFGAYAETGRTPKEECKLEYKTQALVRMRENGEQNGDGRTGTLPQRAYLANPYVPFQPNNPPTYAAKKGVIRGTLFPGLDLPFMGLVNEKPLTDTPLHELQTLSFAMTELGQYLDTHKDDEEAFQLFRSYGELYRKGRKTYEEMCGPLTLSAASMGENYAWMQDPWPWEYAANCRKEG